MLDVVIEDGQQKLYELLTLNELIADSFLAELLAVGQQDLGHPYELASLVATVQFHDVPAHALQHC